MKLSNIGADALSILYKVIDETKDFISSSMNNQHTHVIIHASLDAGDSTLARAYGCRYRAYTKNWYIFWLMFRH